jgi:hypothetical protein
MTRNGTDRLEWPKKYPPSHPYFFRPAIFSDDRPACRSTSMVRVGPWDFPLEPPAEPCLNLLIRVAPSNDLISGDTPVEEHPGFRIVAARRYEMSRVWPVYSTPAVLHPEKNRLGDGMRNRSNKINQNTVRLELPGGNTEFIWSPLMPLFSRFSTQTDPESPRMPLQPWQPGSSEITKP